MREWVVWLLAAATLGAGLGAARPTVAAELPSPLESRLELLVSDIYDVAQWAKKLPYELAMPIVARSRIRSFVASLELDAQVRRRVLERIDSRGFVDELVPFALALRDVYLESEEWAPESFDDWLRRSYAPSDEIPGFEHSMFAWRPAVTQSASDSPPVAAPAPAFDDELIARLVSLYDALYLRAAVDPIEPGDAAGELREQLICARRDSDRARAPAAARVRPIVRDLLADVRLRVPDQGEIAATVDGVLGDEAKLRAVSISIVHFLDTLVCRHYRVFATRVWREAQLTRWMSAELDEPGGGRLWEYLELARRRRRAVLIVVDGLQGHLVASLAAGRPDDPFLREVLAEQQRGAGPGSGRWKAAPRQRTEFLGRLATEGFSDHRYMQFFAEIHERPEGIAEIGIATTPTISVRNLPLAQTGAPVVGPGGTDIPNFHFVDRSVETGGRAYYFYGNDALQLDDLARGAGMRTLFDRLPAVASFSCAAQYDDGAHYRVDSLINLALGEKLRDFAERRCFAELRRRAATEPRLRELRRRLLAKRAVLGVGFAWWNLPRRLGQSDERQLAQKLVRDIAALEQQAMPELLVYYNPWPDHFAHFTGPFADEILAPSGEINRLDYWLGVLTEVYREAGVIDATLFAMAGDHGLTPVFRMLNPEVEVFGGLRDRGYEIEVEKISSDEGEGPRLTDPLRPPSMRGRDAVVASTAGGNYMIDLFVDPAGAGADAGRWRRQPLLDELRRWRPIGAAAATAPIDVVDELYRGLGDSLDYLVVRLEPCDADGGVVAAVGPRGGRRAQATLERRGDRIYVDDPLDLLGGRSLSPYERLDDAQRARHAALVARCLEQARRDDRSSWCDERQWRLLASYTGRPDGAVQLAHLYDTDRAGTINLFPRRGVGYNTVVPGRHAGEGFHEKNAFVGIWGVPVRRRQRPRTALLGAAPAAVYEYLTGRRVVVGRDGWGFAAIALDSGTENGDAGGEKR